MQMSQRICLRQWVNCVTLQQKMPLESACWPHSWKKKKKHLKDVETRCFRHISASALRIYPEQLLTGHSFSTDWDMIILIYLFVFLWEEAHGWGFKNGIFHNSIWLGKKLHSWASCWGSHFFEFIQKWIKAVNFSLLFKADVF